MSSIHSISPDKFARLIGVPLCPARIDVRSNADHAADCDATDAPHDWPASSSAKTP
jgi:hypothetical protein